MKTARSTQHIAKINRLRRLSRLLDNAIPIPGTKLRLGLDPILGLLPGGGDTITGGLSAYIVVEAARMGLPREILVKMIGNIILDSLAGTIPVLGDLFDVGWKANLKNIELLEQYLDPTQKNQSDRLFIFGLIVFLTILVLSLAAITVFAVGWFWQLVTS